MLTIRRQIADIQSEALLIPEYLSNTRKTAAASDPPPEERGNCPPESLRASAPFALVRRRPSSVSPRDYALDGEKIVTVRERNLYLALSAILSLNVLVISGLATFFALAFRRN